MEHLTIDGSRGEGGGSILRLAAALAVTFNKKLTVTNIRAGRKNPGLRAQHLTGLEAITLLSSGKLEGGRIGSTEITFTPGKIKGGEIRLTIGTAGSIGLLYQTLSIACAGALGAVGGRVKVVVDGGATIGKWAPSTGYITNVLSPILERFGFSGTIEVQRHGFYPRGGARAVLVFRAVESWKPLDLLDRGEITRVEGESIASVHLKKPRVAERQASSFKKCLQDGLGGIDNDSIDVQPIYVEASNPGSGITAWARTTTGCILGSGTVVGEKGIRAEKVGADAAKSLVDLVLEHPTATVDEYTSDQLLPFMALSPERSRIVVPFLSSHARTNLDIINEFTERKWKAGERDGGVLLEFPAT